MTRHRIAQIGENRNPKSPENRPQTRRFLQIRLLQLRRSATPFNGLAVLHGRLAKQYYRDAFPLSTTAELWAEAMEGIYYSEPPEWKEKVTAGLKNMNNGSSRMTTGIFGKSDTEGNEALTINIRFVDNQSMLKFS